MSGTGENTEHETRGKARLISYLRGPNARAFLGVFLRKTQAIESAAFEVSRLLNITSGFGVILDAIGSIVGRGRNGLGDDDYKIALRVEIRARRSRGREVDFTEVGEIAIPGSTWNVDTLPPACVRVWSDGPLPSVAAGPMLTAVFNRVRAIGVRMRHDYTLTAEADQFLNGWHTEDTQGDGHGMNWTSANTVGGKLSHLE